MVKFVYKTGNLLDDDADFLVNCVNSNGSMGGGIARQFAEKYPEMEKEYIEDCKNGRYENEFCIRHKTKDKGIFNLLTMTEDMEGSYTSTLTGLYHIATRSTVHGRTIAIPPCGCGIGGLDIEIIHREILYIFRNFYGEVRLYNFNYF